MASKNRPTLVELVGSDFVLVNVELSNRSVAWLDAGVAKLKKRDRLASRKAMIRGILEGVRVSGIDITRITDGASEKAIARSFAAYLKAGRPVEAAAGE